MLALALIVLALPASARPSRAADTNSDSSLSAQDSSILAQLVTVVELMKLEAQQDSLRGELNAIQAQQLEYRDNWALWPAVIAILIVAIWSSGAFRRRSHAA